MGHGWRQLDRRISIPAPAGSGCLRHHCGSNEPEPFHHHLYGHDYGRGRRNNDIDDNPVNNLDVHLNDLNDDSDNLNHDDYFDHGSRCVFDFDHFDYFDDHPVNHDDVDVDHNAARWNRPVDGLAQLDPFARCCVEWRNPSWRVGALCVPDVKLARDQCAVLPERCARPNRGNGTVGLRRRIGHSG